MIHLGVTFFRGSQKPPRATQDKRLARLNESLRLAVPQLDGLELERDADGRPHLTARYKHWRVNGARQDERDFSDGTLRLIAILWTLIETGNTGTLLLEEPELSLHSEVVRQLPSLFHNARTRKDWQVILSSHSNEILHDPGLGLDEVLVLKPSDEGTTATLARDFPDVRDAVTAGVDLAEMLVPLTRPADVDGLSMSVSA